MVSQTPDEIEAQLDAGTWLTSGQITTLLGRGRTTVWRWLNDLDEAGAMRYRETQGGVREYHPEDVRRMVDDARRVRGGAGQPED